MKQSNRKRFFICWFPLQMAITDGYGSGWNQEPRTPSRSATQVAGTQVLGLSPTVIPCILVGKWSGSRVAGTCNGALIWLVVLQVSEPGWGVNHSSPLGHAGLARGSLTYCTADTPSLNFIFLCLIYLLIFIFNWKTKGGQMYAALQETPFLPKMWDRKAKQLTLFF